MQFLAHLVTDICYMDTKPIVLFKLISDGFLLLPFLMTSLSILIEKDSFLPKMR